MLRTTTLTLTFALALGGAVHAQDRLVPFNEFIDSVTDAAPARYVGAAGAEVASAAAFEEMRGHVLSLYHGVTVAHSFVLDNQIFDCIPVAQQPSARGLSGIASPPPSPDSGDAVDVAPRHDKFGNAIPCESGTIPMRRITLEELSRFRSLREFLRKGPDGAGQLPRHQTRAGETHKYAHAYQYVNNFGGESVIGLWRPKVNLAKTHIFSLSQHWYVAFPNQVTQTAEIGWQNYPQKYGSENSALFIYWTADGYKQTGCYNLDCAAFVQTDNAILLGVGFTHYSSKTGKHYDVKLGYRFYNNNWWMLFGSRFVGYYPGTKYGGVGMSVGAQEIDYGGETVGATNWPPMGSGSWPSQGSNKAAMQSKIYYYLNNNGNKAAASLTADQPSPACYKIKLHNRTSSSKKTWFLYGGPGGSGCQ